jgi:hypothetical protein
VWSSIISFFLFLFPSFPNIEQHITNKTSIHTYSAKRRKHDSYPYLQKPPRSINCLNYPFCLAFGTQFAYPYITYTLLHYLPQTLPDPVYIRQCHQTSIHPPTPSPLNPTVGSSDFGSRSLLSCCRFGGSELFGYKYR